MYTGTHKEETDSALEGKNRDNITLEEKFVVRVRDKRSNDCSPPTRTIKRLSMHLCWPTHFCLFHLRGSRQNRERYNTMAYMYLYVSMAMTMLTGKVTEHLLLQFF